MHISLSFYKLLYLYIQLLSCKCVQ